MIALTVHESRDLVRLERVVHDGVSRLQAMAAALLEIRERRLYRANYPDFESYCQCRWGYTRQRVNQLIAAGEVIRDLPPPRLETNGFHEEITERQCRELAKVEPESRAEVWETASPEPTRPPTAAEIAARVAEARLQLGAEGVRRLVVMEEAQILRQQKDRLEREAAEDRAERLDCVIKRIKQALKQSATLGDEAADGRRLLHEAMARFMQLASAATANTANHAD